MLNAELIADYYTKLKQCPNCDADLKQITVKTISDELGAVACFNCHFKYVRMDIPEINANYQLFCDLVEDILLQNSENRLWAE